jgi:hypothetical protein
MSLQIRRSTLILPVNVAEAMVDIPVYRRAKHILEQATAIAQVEKRKADALASIRRN